MPKWTIFVISFLRKHRVLCFHYWDYLTNFWRNNWPSMIEIFRKTAIPAKRFKNKGKVNFWSCDQSCTLVWMHKLKFKSWKVSKCTMFARKVLQFCLSHHLSAPPGTLPLGKKTTSQWILYEWHHNFLGFLDNYFATLTALLAIFNDWKNHL